MKHHRISLSNLEHRVQKHFDADGNLFLTSVKNYVGPALPFTVVATASSDFDGREVTLALSRHETFDQAVAALIESVAGLPSTDQKAAHESIVSQRAKAKALEAKIKRQNAWVKRKFEIQAQRDELRRLQEFV